MSDLAVQVDPFALWKDLEQSGQVTPTSINLAHRELSYDECESLAAFLGEISRRARWYIGDLIVYSEKIHGELVAQIAEATGLAPQTVENISSVAHRVPPERRVPELSFSHHAEVASLLPPEQENWLALSVENNWRTHELRAQIQAEKAQENGNILSPAVLNPKQAWETVWHSSRRVVGDSFLVPAEPFLALRDAFDA